jgi:hypothetical protein
MAIPSKLNLFFLLFSRREAFYINGIEEGLVTELD